MYSQFTIVELWSKFPSLTPNSLYEVVRLKELFDWRFLIKLFFDFKNRRAKFDIFDVKTQNLAF